MPTSLNHLLKGALRHWYQLLGGMAMAVVGLIGAIDPMSDGDP